MLQKIKMFIVSSCLLLLAACHTEPSNSLKVGTIAGPESELMEIAKQVAKNKFGLDITVIEFTDYLEPNIALNDGSIDANVFQHQAFLDQQTQDRRYKLVAIGKTFVYPMGIYSSKIKSFSQLKPNGIVAIPNDPSNEGRALLLLQEAGIIKLKATAGLYSTPIDIESNPQNLQFKELDAAQLARALPDVEIAVINTNYAIPAGLSPTKDAIFHEQKDSPYANIIVIRESQLNDPRMKQLVAAIESDEVLAAAKKIFKDQAIQAW